MKTAGVSKINVWAVVTAVVVLGTAWGGDQSTTASSVTSTAVSSQTGDRMVDYFEVHDADMRSVFRQLSSYSGVDIVVSDAVKGNVTLTVTNKSWREILGIVCRVNNLAAVKENNYIYVITQDEYRKRAVDEVTGEQMSADASPLKREVIRIKHTPATEMKDAIQALISSRGKINVVNHTNALIIFDTDENIAQIKKMIADLDIEVAQISISCKIIEVSSGTIQRLGVHWGYFDEKANVSAEHLPGTKGFVAGALENISYGILSPENLSVALEYLFTDHKGEVVAQPQITTIDNKEAKIFMGQQIPVKYKDEAGNTVVQMINAGTALVVTPHISGEGRIMLALNPKKESYQLQEGIPVINEQSATTNVVVNNGETVVIAGLTSNEVQNAEDGIPVLKDIPLIGILFKRSSKTLDKRDLIIFVTPHIIETRAVAAPEGSSGMVQPAGPAVR